MPWSDEQGRSGLQFVASGKTFAAFEVLLRWMRWMIGADDGIRDALFRFTRPVSGSYFWCPPVQTWPHRPVQVQFASCSPKVRLWFVN